MKSTLLALTLAALTLAAPVARMASAQDDAPRTPAQAGAGGNQVAWEALAKAMILEVDGRRLAVGVADCHAAAARPRVRAIASQGVTGSEILVKIPSGGGEMGLRLTGAERVVRVMGPSMQALRVESLVAPLECPGGRALVQDAESLDGLVLDCFVPGGGALPFTLEKTGEDLELRVDLGLPDRASASGSRDAALVLRLTPFTGSALAALETAGAAPAETSWTPCDDPVALERFEPWIGQGRRMERYVMAPSTGWDFFADQDRLLRPLLADQREAQVRVGFGRALRYRDNYDKCFDASFGGDIVVLRHKFAPGRMLSLSVRGLFASRFEINGEEPDGDGEFPLLCTDYFGGGALAYTYDANTLELFVYHESSHLGDETILTGSRVWENYSREAARLLWSRDLGALRLYGGGSYNLHSVTKDLHNRWGYQAGAEYRFSLADQPFYAAVDVQGWGYNDWRPGVNTQLGWFWGDPAENPLWARCYLEYYNGYSNMGQFWNEKEQTLMLGLGLLF